MLVVKRIHVIYQLRAAASSIEAVERAHRIHAMSCPLYRTLHKAIEITTELQMEDE